MVEEEEGPLSYSWTGDTNEPTLYDDAFQASSSLFLTDLTGVISRNEWLSLEGCVSSPALLRIESWHQTLLHTPALASFPHPLNKHLRVSGVHQSDLGQITPKKG